MHTCLCTCVYIVCTHLGVCICMCVLCACVCTCMHVNTRVALVGCFKGRYMFQLNCAGVDGLVLLCSIHIPAGLQVFPNYRGCFWGAE